MPVHAHKSTGNAVPRPSSEFAGRHGKNEAILHCPYTTRDIRRELHRVQARSRWMKVALIFGVLIVLIGICAWFLFNQN